MNIFEKGNQLLIYVPRLTNRLEYIFSFIFNNVLRLNYGLTDNLTFFIQAGNPKFSYAPDALIPDCLYLKSHEILFEDTIHPIEIEVVTFENQVYFFKDEISTLLPFDIFAASFYLISRYEEYLPYKADKYDRFPAEESIAKKENFLEEPIINIWANVLKNKLLNRYPELVFEDRKFRFKSTIDIDNAYAHLHKGIVRTSLSLIQILFTKPSLFFLKIKILCKIVPDPYDTYSYLNDIHKVNNLTPIYFILFSNYGKHDKNLPKRNKTFQKLIKKIVSHNQFGLHPSYQSNYHFKKLENEKNELEKVSGKNITRSRQHYLKLNIPATYEKLIQLGIKEDYSMGYSSSPGFRAGTCNPFYFFNLKTNQVSNLKIIPFSVMDVCFIEYLKYEPERTLKKIKKIINSIKKVNGLFVSLWHNENLNTQQGQFSWREVFEKMLEEANDGN